MRAGVPICDCHRQGRSGSVAGLEWCVGADPKEASRLDHRTGAVGELLRAIDGYKGAFVTRCALRLAPLVFVRPGELRAAQWAEFDFDKSEWRIPATRMKGRVQHIVPLSTQALAVLRELQPLTGRFPFAFPSVRSRFRAMSENAITGALAMGYTGQDMTGHGFRSMASTLLNEQVGIAMPSSDSWRTANATPGVQLAEHSRAA